VTLSGGTGSCSLATGTAGSGQTITGNYSGNATYSASSGATTLTVNKALAVVAVGVNPATITLGQATTVSANVSGGVGTPTGVVTVSGGGGSCGITLTNGAGSCTLAPNTTGSGIVVTGSYGGDGKYANGTGTTSLTVNKVGANVAIGISPSSTSVGAPVMATATVSGASGMPTGTVSVSGAGGACMITLANGTGACQLTPNVAGNNQTITGSYSGDATYASGVATTMLSVSGGVGSGPPVLDIDVSGAIDALTDGMLVERYLLGLSGSSLTLNVLSPDARRTDPAQIVAYLQSIVADLDIDGDGYSDALTDGIMILRYLFGIRGDALIQNALSPNATRTTAAAIEAYIQTLLQ
jgi:hypothetical protein